jgi:hypothetical protein
VCYKTTQQRQSLIWQARRAADLHAGEVFIANLTAKFGNASRVMWPSFERHETEVTFAMVQLINEVMERVDKEI